MKPFARINLFSVLSSVALAKGDALRRGILVSYLALAAAESPVNRYEFRRSQRLIGSDIIAVTIIDGKRVMVDPQTLKPLDAVPIAHPKPKD